MQISDLLARMGGLQAMAGELGLSEQQVARGAGALLPAILGGLQKRAQAGPGAAAGAGPGGLFEQLGGGSLLDQVLSPQPTDLNVGNDVLGQIFGSKDVSRAVAANAAAQTGLDSTLLKKMLPMLAMLAAGWIARQQGGADGAAASPAPAPGELGGLGGLLGGLLGGDTPAAAGAGGLGGLGGLASMLDADGNGNPLDDILRMMNQGRR
ncbi:MAG: hypothetical protein ABS84_16970 [Rubrivivax sp. SCN 71-131]|jgi:hypothetical protein|nr:MAG: hypothetical protein ABS84_16970 [Rubrivivax sp. SCN 71-131]